MTEKEMEIKPGEVLYHLGAGDGDNLFVFAGSKEQAIQKVVEDGEFSADMITMAVALPNVCKASVAEGRRQEREYIGGLLCCLIGNTMLDGHKGEGHRLGRKLGVISRIQLSPKLRPEASSLLHQTYVSA